MCVLQPDFIIDFDNPVVWGRLKSTVYSKRLLEKLCLRIKLLEIHGIHVNIVDYNSLWTTQ